MRLIRYINEQDDTGILGDPILGKGEKSNPSSRFIEMVYSEAIPRIKKDCKPILRFIKKNKNFLWRGLNRWDTGFEVITPRKDRYPTDTSERLHEAFDKFYYKKYGWKPRSEGVFVTNHQRGTEGYGPAHVIFPVGRFMYTWSKEFPDFYVWILRHLKPSSTQKEVDDTINTIISELYNNNKDIDKWSKLPRMTEMMIKCKKYYAINYEFVEGATAKYPGFESDFQDAFFI